MLKKMFHKFFVNERGAVSLYLVIIALVLLLFNAVLIDYARIMVAERQTEEAAKTSLRSTMASYNTALQDKGLFGFDGESNDEAEEIFKDVFEKNLMPEGEGDYFNLLGLESVNDEVKLNLDFERSLANESILDYQILEEMKYKAPVEVGEALVKDFLSIVGKVEDASDQADLASKINKDAKDREEKLDEVEDLLRDARDILLNIEDEVTSDTTTEYPDVGTLNDIKEHFEKYQDDLDDIEAEEEKEEDEENDEDNEDGNDEEDEEVNEENDEKEEEDEERSIEDKEDDADDFLEQANDLLDNIKGPADGAVEDLSEALELIDSAEKLNVDIQTKIEEKKKKGNSGDYDDAKEVSEGSTEEGVGESVFEDYVLDDDLFTELKEKVEASKACLDEECSLGDESSTTGMLPSVENLRADIHLGSTSSRVADKVDEADTAITGAYTEVDDAIKEMLELLNDERKDYKENEDKIKEKEEEADSELKEAVDVIDDIRDGMEIYGIVQKDIATYDYLEDVLGDYGDAIVESGKEFDMDDVDEAADEASSFADSLFQKIGDALINARDRMYINEYILLRFSSHDFKETGAKQFSYDSNQVEYIIYGKHEFGENFMLAMGEIATLRFIINLAAGLIDQRGTVFGPLKWAYALTSAASWTVQDMSKINKGKPIKLFHVGRSPKITYEDHLRLFLMLHPNGDTKSRLMAAIDEDSGKEDLRKKATYVSGEATSTVDLWFLPQIADMLEKTGAINGRVKDGKFYIEKEVNYSY